MAHGEERPVDREQVLGVGVAHVDAGLERPEAGVLRRVVPDRRLALLHVHLLQREGHQLHVPVGAAGETGLVEVPELEPSDKVIDLMAALEQSVKAAKEARGRHPAVAKGERDEDEKAEKKPARKRKSA